MVNLITDEGAILPADLPADASVERIVEELTTVLGLNRTASARFLLLRAQTGSYLGNTLENVADGELLWFTRRSAANWSREGGNDYHPSSMRRRIELPFPVVNTSVIGSELPERPGSLIGPITTPAIDRSRSRHRARVSSAASGVPHRRWLLLTSTGRVKASLNQSRSKGMHFSPNSRMVPFLMPNSAAQPAGSSSA